MDERRSRSGTRELPEDACVPGAAEPGDAEQEARFLSGRLEEPKELVGRLLSLMNNVPGVVYRGLRDWSITFIGAEIHRLTGHGAGELIEGRVKWRDLIHPDDLGRVKAAFRSAVSEGRKVLRVEYRIRARDGAVRWLEDRRQLFYDGGGAFAYVDGLLLDITEPKWAEEALRATNEKLAALIEACPVPIMALDGDGKVIMWNAAAESVFGWAANEAIGRANPIVPEDAQERFRQLLGRVMLGEGISGVELRRARKDGSPIDVILSAAPIRNARGVTTGVMAVLLDVTERKRMEEALRKSEEQFRQSQKMEAVGRLAGGIAHDFNNLLTAIHGYSDLLLRSLPPLSPHRREVEEIRKAGDRAASLTQQLLAFSRKQVLQPRVLDLNGVVANLDKMLRRLIGENIDLVTVLAPGLWSVKVDAGQIEQVIMNLAVNAKDAMPRGGVLTVETANVEFGFEHLRERPEAEAGPYVMLAVSDTGYGMDAETRARIFEPFFTTKEMGKGTGLGLSTVYGIVKQSSGYVWAESEVGFGTAIRVYIPRCADAAVERVQERTEHGALRGRETVLLVEDDEVVRELVEEVLAGNGYTVLTASDGQEALETGTRYDGTIHLLVTDVVMPRMGGRELADKLTARRAGLCVLYMSGYTDTDIVHDGMLDPGTEFLQKPFRVDALLRKVREVIRQ